MHLPWHVTRKTHFPTGDSPAANTLPGQGPLQPSTALHGAGREGPQMEKLEPTLHPRALLALGPLASIGRSF